MPLKTPYLSIPNSDTKAFTKTTAMNSFQNSFQINVQKKRKEISNPVTGLHCSPKMHRHWSGAVTMSVLSPPGHAI